MTPCPPGGPLSLGDCQHTGPFAAALAALAAVLYVAALSFALWRTTGLRGRGPSGRGAARDWYLIVAALGMVFAPLLAFTIVAAFASMSR